MKKITLQVNGREMTFTEQELVAIVEKHLLSETTKEITVTKVAQKWAEDEWFEVKPHAIDQKLFEKKRKDTMQENTRQLILKAFEKMKANPEKYGKNFKTLMPKREWKVKTVMELKEMARDFGDHNADWVEQALEWAQRIANGESWKSICNDDDTANWFRLVVWKNGYARLVGGSVGNGNCHPASYVYSSDYRDYEHLQHTVPLVVLYE